MLFIYSWAWRLIAVWDLIEESDAFTDAERLRITNVLWGLANYVAGTHYFRKETPPPLEIRQNHWTFAGLSGSFCARYFEAYYGITEFKKQIRFSQAVFDGQAESYKPNDDAGGGWWGYCWLAPYHQVIYDLKRDDFRFLESGQLRAFADYGILVTDNLGVPVSFGDAWSYIEPGRYAVALRNKTISLEFAMALCTAAWYYEDGGYLWALDWMGGAPYPGCYYRALQKRVPDRLAGIAIAPFNRPLYEWVERHARGGANVPIEEAFDKLVLRGGFDRDDEYLLLDGTSTFAHGHEDGNSIERLTWKGRMWLAELDYIWKRPRHHSSVVSICGGGNRGGAAAGGVEVGGGVRRGRVHTNGRAGIQRVGLDAGYFLGEGGVHSGCGLSQAAAGRGLRSQVPVADAGGDSAGRSRTDRRTGGSVLPDSEFG